MHFASLLGKSRVEHRNITQRSDNVMYRHSGSLAKVSAEQLLSAEQIRRMDSQAGALLRVARNGPSASIFLFGRPGPPAWPSLVSMHPRRGVHFHFRASLRCFARWPAAGKSRLGDCLSVSGPGLQASPSGLVDRAERGELAGNEGPRQGIWRWSRMDMYRRTCAAHCASQARCTGCRSRASDSTSRPGGRTEEFRRARITAHHRLRQVELVRGPKADPGSKGFRGGATADESEQAPPSALGTTSVKRRSQMLWQSSR